MESFLYSCCHHTRGRAPPGPAGGKPPGPRQCQGRQEAGEEIYREVDQGMESFQQEEEQEFQAGKLGLSDRTGFLGSATFIYTRIQPCFPSRINNLPKYILIVE